MVRPMPDGTLLLTGRGRLLTPRPYDGPGPWAIFVRDGLFAWVGPLADAPAADSTVDLGTALVTPGLVDAHTHPAFAGDRSDEAAARLGASLASGVTTIECKSGYGLSTGEELRALRLIGEAADGLPIRVVRTFLGAHAVPPQAASAARHEGGVG